MLLSAEGKHNCRIVRQPLPPPCPPTYACARMCICSFKEKQCANMCDKSNINGWSYSVADLLGDRGGQDLIFLSLYTYTHLKRYKTIYMFWFI